MKDNIQTHIDKKFEKWWYDEGSAVGLNEDKDYEENMYDISKIAWSNGVYKCIEEIGTCQTCDHGEKLDAVFWTDDQCMYTCFMLENNYPETFYCGYYKEKVK